MATETGLMKDNKPNGGPKQEEIPPARTPTEDEQLQIDISEGTAEVTIFFSFVSWYLDRVPDSG